ncbi:MAG: (Fe-S)-binding protein [Desulfobacterales bacterium]|nr:(Fe-S)-binding protein [Desulfobacterales bacterium]
MTGNGPMEKVRRIEATDCSIGPQEMRQRLLKTVMGARLDTPAEFVILTGCRSPAGFIHLSHLVKLLNYYAVDYTFLSEETCCGNSFLDGLDSSAETGEAGLLADYARNFEGRNLDRIRKLGAGKIVTACPGCNTRYNQFQAHGDVEILYYTQLLARYAKDIRLDSEVNFYEGCHKHHRLPGFKIDIQSSRALVKGMQALDVTDIPNYCCRNLAEKIFEKANTGTIVTPTSCCWSFLTNQAKPDSPDVLTLTQLMCRSLGIE